MPAATVTSPVPSCTSALVQSILASNAIKAAAAALARHHALSSFYRQTDRFTAADKS